MWMSTLKSQMIVLTEGEIYHNNVLIVLIPYHFRIQTRHLYTSRFLVYLFLYYSWTDPEISNILSKCSFEIV